MNTMNIFGKFLLAGTFVIGLGLTSCEDFLTVLPADKTTEDDFWKDKNDLDNVRAATYAQMCNANVTGRILYWGELRSDNFSQNDMSQTDITYLQSAILQPTQGMFKWDAFYKGINYCNKVLEKGEMMTEEGNEVDPSFRRGDWLPIKAEMLSMRALYYFYLVRAFRDVPYVTHSVSTDAEAMSSRIAATPGAMILADLCDQLEEAKTYGRDKFSTSSETKGRFTKRSTSALLADIYLWRGCMLRHASEKGDTIVSAEGDTLTQSQMNTLSITCFEKAIEHSDYVLQQMQAEYEENLALSGGVEVDDPNRIEEFPYMQYINSRSTMSVYDVIYSDIFGGKNGTESVFELQYDGTSLVNTAIGSYLGKYVSPSLQASAMIGASTMTSSAPTTINPERGFGKTDIRLLETYKYSSSNSSQMFQKNICYSVIIPDLKDVTSGSSSTPSYRSQSNMDANWPVYRLTDVMLIKAEAIARRYMADPSSPNPKASADENNKAGYAVNEGFKMVNYIFKRCNPVLKESGAGEYNCDRIRADYACRSGQELTASDLLMLVYNERQREFVGEGKRWFDIVRQAEFSNDPTTTLTNYITMTSAVRNRLKQIYSLYNPINTDEIKINGVDYGGKLKQNPVWDRYTTK